MKQLLSLFVIGAIVFSFTSSCVESSKKFKALQAQLDSIQTNYGSQYGGLDEAFSILNEVEDGLRSIRLHPLQQSSLFQNPIYLPH